MENSIWSNMELNQEYGSPLGYRFLYPQGWRLEAQGSRVFASPGELPFWPLVVLTAQVTEDNLPDLQARLIRQVERDPQAHLVDSRSLEVPRDAVCLQVSYQSSEDVRLCRYYVSELLDSGKLCLVFLSSDWEGRGQEGNLDYLLDVWRQSRVDQEVSAAPGFRLVSLESMRVAWEFPENWVVQNMHDSRVEIRSPARTLLSPNIVLETAHTDTPATLEQLVDDALAGLSERSGVSKVRQEQVSIGNRRGMCISYRAPNPNQRFDQVMLFIAQPSDDGHMSITLAGLEERWSEYEPAFQHVRESFRWM